MSKREVKSFNGLVYQKAYKRLNLTPTQRIIFQRLLGLLLKYDSPFPFSAVSMAELTGFSLRTIFYTLNDLENLRLIARDGLGKNRRFSRGSILIKILTTVQNRIKNNQDNNSTTVQLVHQKSNNRATVAYRKTSFSLKHKQKGDSLTQIQLQEIKYYQDNPQHKMPDEIVELLELLEDVKE